MQTNGTLTDIETLALAKALASKAVKSARESIEAGEYEVSFDAHIEGSVRVGEDYEQRMVNKAKPWNLVYVLLEEVNKLRASAGEAGLDMDKLMAMADAVDPNLVKQAKKDAESKAATIKAATLSSAKGKVTTKLDVTPSE